MDFSGRRNDGYADYLSHLISVPELGDIASLLEVEIIGFGDAGLATGTADDQIWEYSRSNGCAIVSKDEDYNNLSVVRGNPPKVIWLQLGNCTTGQVEAAFRARYPDLEEFEKDSSVGTIVLS